MSKKFPKINIKFHFNVITHNKLMNMFSYYITTYLFLVIKITILIVILIQCTKRTLSVSHGPCMFGICEGLWNFQWIVYNIVQWLLWLGCFLFIQNSLWEEPYLATLFIGTRYSRTLGNWNGKIIICCMHGLDFLNGKSFQFWPKINESYEQ